MDFYKIKIVKTDKFLWSTHRKLQAEEFSNYTFDIDSRGHVNHPWCDKYDETQDLDLFKANAWKIKLMDMGIDCEIIKINYPKKGVFL